MRRRIARRSGHPMCCDRISADDEKADLMGGERLDKLSEVAIQLHLTHPRTFAGGAPRRQKSARTPADAAKNPDRQERRGASNA